MIFCIALTVFRFKNRWLSWLSELKYCVQPYWVTIVGYYSKKYLNSLSSKQVSYTTFVLAVELFFN